MYENLLPLLVFLEALPLNGVIGLTENYFE
jgi:hypothetical protein